MQAEAATALEGLDAVMAANDSVLQEHLQHRIAAAGTHINLMAVIGTAIDHQLRHQANDPADSPDNAGCSIM